MLGKEKGFKERKKDGWLGNIVLTEVTEVSPCTTGKSQALRLDLKVRLVGEA